MCSLHRMFVSSYARIAQCHQAFGQDPARANIKRKREREKKRGAQAHGNRHCAAVLITPNGSIRRSVLIKSRGIPASSAPAPAGTLRRLLQPRPHWLAAWGGHEGSSSTPPPPWPRTRSQEWECQSSAWSNHETPRIAVFVWQEPCI